MSSFVIFVCVLLFLQSFSVAHASNGRWQQYIYNGPAGSRPYFVYTPANYQIGRAVPLIVMLHGCLQTPADFAASTRMDQLADQKQFIVVYPQQTSIYNASECWNSFETTRGSGEPAIIAGITRAVEHNTAQWKIDTNHIYVAGISAGAAMAVILGATYPDIFAAIGVHSGVEYQWAQQTSPSRLSQTGAAAVEAQAQAAMKLPNDMYDLFHEESLSVFPPGPDPLEQGEKAYKAMGSFARVVPTIVFQGTADPVVNPINGDQVVQQWLCTDQLASHGAFKATFEYPSSATLHQMPHGQRYTVFTWQDTHRSDVLAYWKVDGMRHAWSGGSPYFLFTDPQGPSASLAMHQFFEAHTLS